MKKSRKCVASQHGFHISDYSERHKDPEGEVYVGCIGHHGGVLMG